MPYDTTALSRVSRARRSCTLPEQFQYLAARQPGAATGPNAVNNCGDAAYEGDVSWFGAGWRGSAIAYPQTLLKSVYVERRWVVVAVSLAAALEFVVAG